MNVLSRDMAIERRVGRKVPHRLKPGPTVDAFRGAEAPLVYGAAGAPARGCPHGAAPAPAFPTQRPGLTLIIGLALMVGLSLTAGAQTGKDPQTIVFMTDFGVVDDSVAICRGVMYSIMPEVRIVDLTHVVTPFSILDGARFLAGATPYYPAGTVFVVVIDPTVGSARKAIVAKSKRGQYFVLPD